MLRRWGSKVCLRMLAYAIERENFYSVCGCVHFENLPTGGGCIFKKTIWWRVRDGHSEKKYGSNLKRNLTLVCDVGQRASSRPNSSRDQHIATHELTLSERTDNPADGLVCKYFWTTGPTKNTHRSGDRNHERCFINCPSSMADVYTVFKIHATFEINLRIVPLFFLSPKCLQTSW
jgi:hypothetical protein